MNQEIQYNMDNNWEKQYIVHDIRPQQRIYGNNNAGSATMAKNVPRPFSGRPKSQSATPINPQLPSNQPCGVTIHQESCQT